MSQPSPIRIRRAPVVDGPYDDERGGRPSPEVTGALALAFPDLDATAPQVPLRLVPPAAATDAAGPCPPLRPLATRLAQAIAEILAGGRSPAQLAPFATFDVLAQLERSAGRLNGRRPGVGTRPKVTSIHVSEPATRIAEVCVVFDTGARRRAFAMRLESPASRWRCTALQLG